MEQLVVRTPQGEFTISNVIQYRQDCAFVEVEGKYVGWVPVEDLYIAEVDNVWPQQVQGSKEILRR